MVERNLSISPEFLQDQIVQRPGTQLFALVELGLLSDIRVLPSFIDKKVCKSAHGSLLAETRESEAIEIGPRLIDKLSKNDLNWLIQNAIPRGAVSWIVSNRAHIELVKHLRACTDVVSVDDDESFFWRFYDPMHIGSLTQVLTPLQFKAMMNSIQHWIWIDPWLELQQYKTEAQTPEDDEALTDLIPFKLDTEQIEKLTQLSIPGSVIDQVKHLGIEAWPSNKAMTSQDEYAVASHFVRTGYILGLDSVPDILTYIHLSSSIHPDIWMKVPKNESLSNLEVLSWFESLEDSDRQKLIQELNEKSALNLWKPSKGYAFVS